MESYTSGQRRRAKPETYTNREGIVSDRAVISSSFKHVMRDFSGLRAYGYV